MIAAMKEACAEAANPRTWLEAAIVICAMVVTYGAAVAFLGGCR